MNKKTLIQAIVIVACFSGSGLVLYNGLIKKNTTPLPANVSMDAMMGSASGSLDGNAVSIDTNQAVLPYGGLSSAVLDNLFKKSSFEFGKQDYPKLNPASDLGVGVSNLIPPLPAAK